MRRYPAWLLAALLVSGYMVIFHFGRALAWSSNLADCLQDPGVCLTNLAGRWVVVSWSCQEVIEDQVKKRKLGPGEREGRVYGWLVGVAA